MTCCSTASVVKWPIWKVAIRSWLRPSGQQVTIEGMVRRPAIYELRDEKNLAEVLEPAGGIFPAAALQHIEVQRLVAHEKRTMLKIDISTATAADEITKQLAAFSVQDGDQVHIFPIAPFNESAIYLQGHVVRPGRYSFSDGMKVTDLIKSYGDLLPEPAAHYAEIVRLSPPDFRPSVESFDLSLALADPAAAPKLEAHDTVRIFGRYDFEPAPEVWIGGRSAHGWEVSYFRSSAPARRHLPCGRSHARCFARVRATVPHPI